MPSSNDEPCSNNIPQEEVFTGPKDSKSRDGVNSSSTSSNAREQDHPHHQVWSFSLCSKVESSKASKTYHLPATESEDEEPADAHLPAMDIEGRNPLTLIFKRRTTGTRSSLTLVLTCPPRRNPVLHAPRGELLDDLLQFLPICLAP